VVQLTPREFLEEMVRPSVAAWRVDHLNARLAKQAANELNNMVDRMLYHWGQGAAEVWNTSTPAEYRRKLVTDVCQDFQLVWDIADAHKHVELGRPDRAITCDDQTAPGTLGYGEGRYGEGLYGGVEQLVVRLDDGTRRAVSGPIENVLAMWDKIAQP
jgi:hypothetical protein